MSKNTLWELTHPSQRQKHPPIKNLQFKFEHKTETPVSGLINSTHCQGRKADVNNELNLHKIYVGPVCLAYPHLDPMPQAKLLLMTNWLEAWGAEFFKSPC